MVNGTCENHLIINTKNEYKNASYEMYNCCGELINKVWKNLIIGINAFEVPVAGIIIIKPRLLASALYFQETLHFLSSY